MFFPLSLINIPSLHGGSCNYNNYVCAGVYLYANLCMLMDLFYTHVCIVYACLILSDFNNIILSTYTY